ncbi:MAG: SDR family NAD(P)-dependent oxidoreductase [Wenzhouxiangellaceae bacterium]|nr:SDR family NAD(P)-dependent oxidoreductase [Wenzhouxiangellaceae bacterium]
MAIVLITGAGKGIGLATTLAFARAGHTVAAGMRNPVKSPELDEVAAREKLDASIHAMDVDDDASMIDAIDRVAQDDDAWYDPAGADFGLDARPKP